jgi:hypothetical protein
MIPSPKKPNFAIGKSLLLESVWRICPSEERSDLIMNDAKQVNGVYLSHPLKVGRSSRRCCDSFVMQIPWVETSGALQITIAA